MSVPKERKGGPLDYNAVTFAIALLGKLGAPQSNANVKALVAWEAAEGGNWNNDATFNPLNTTEPMPGYHKVGTQGNIGAYTSWQQGLNATVKTLQNGDYGSVISALKEGHNAEAVANAVTSSPWGTKQIDVNADYSSYGQSGGGNSAEEAPGSGGSGGLDEPANVSIDKYLSNPKVASQYGYLAAFLKDPVIGPILAKAAKGGWSQDRLQGALMKTTWWKTTSQSARNWQAQQKLDPATAKQTLNQTENQIQQLAKSTLGQPLDPKRVASMANAAIAASWSNAQLQEAVGAEFQYQGAQAKYKGAAGQTVDTFQQLASQYLVPVSNQSIAQWTKQVLEGNNTTDDFKSYLQAQAESLYPTLTSALKGGQTVQQYMDPYAQMASQILEKPTGAFNFMNPKWSKALNTVQPDGTRAPMSLSAWGDYLRSTPEYKQTQQASEQVASFGQALGNLFGKVSTGADDSGLNTSTAVTTS